MCIIKEIKNTIHICTQIVKTLREADDHELT